MFLTSKSLPVYETKDLGLAKLKLDAFGANELVYVVDVEQSEYFKVILMVIEKVFPEAKREGAPCSARKTQTSDRTYVFA